MENFTRKLDFLKEDQGKAFLNGTFKTCGLIKTMSIPAKQTKTYLFRILKTDQRFMTIQGAFVQKMLNPGKNSKFYGMFFNIQREIEKETGKG